MVSYSVQLYMYISQIYVLFTKKIAASYLLTCEIVIRSLTQDNMSVSVDVACKCYQFKQFIVDSCTTETFTPPLGINGYNIYIYIYIYIYLYIYNIYIYIYIYYIYIYNIYNIYIYIYIYYIYYIYIYI